MTTSSAKPRGGFEGGRAGADLGLPVRVRDTGRGACILGWGCSLCKDPKVKVRRPSSPEARQCSRCPGKFRESECKSPASRSAAPVPEPHHPQLPRWCPGHGALRE